MRRQPADIPVQHIAPRLGDEVPGHVVLEPEPEAVQGTLEGVPHTHDDGAIDLRRQVSQGLLGSLLPAHAMEVNPPIGGCLDISVGVVDDVHKGLELGRGHEGTHPEVAQGLMRQDEREALLRGDVVAEHDDGPAERHTCGVLGDSLLIGAALRGPGVEPRVPPTEVADGLVQLDVKPEALGEPPASPLHHHARHAVTNGGGNSTALVQEVACLGGGRFSLIELLLDRGISARGPHQELTSCGVWRVLPARAVLLVKPRGERRTVVDEREVLLGHTDGVGDYTSISLLDPPGGDAQPARGSKECLDIPQDAGDSRRLRANCSLDPRDYVVAIVDHPLYSNRNTRAGAGRCDRRHLMGLRDKALLHGEGGPRALFPVLLRVGGVGHLLHELKERSRGRRGVPAPQEVVGVLTIGIRSRLRPGVTLVDVTGGEERYGQYLLRGFPGLLCRCSALEVKKRICEILLR